MMFRVRTSALTGLDAISIDVEVEITTGTKTVWTVIGLGDSAVKEARDRVGSALRYYGYTLPSRVLINLAPAEVKKEGSSFDCAILVGILIASGALPPRDDIDRIRFHGEVALDGTFKPARGIAALTIEAVRSGATIVVVPEHNVEEAQLIEGVSVVGVGSLRDLISFMKGELLAHDPIRTAPCRMSESIAAFAEVKGQETAKRALEISAAGGHNILMIGPPGCGKSMLAVRFRSLLPRLSRAEMLEVVKIHSIAGLPIVELLQGLRPMRSPHHGASDVGLIGGGSPPRPGEISLAHRGVLFLDELPEYSRTALEGLRAPLEGGQVVITRARGSLLFPARFQLVAAMNPCPCGRLGVSGVSCECSPGAIQGYLRKLSQPILDRIDLHVEMEAVPLGVLSTEYMQVSTDESEQARAARVHHAVATQIERAGVLNAQLGGDALRRAVSLTSDGIALLDRASKRLGLSARSFTRVLRVARTIADLREGTTVTTEDLAEAIGYRSLERFAQYLSSSGRAA